MDGILPLKQILQYSQRKQYEKTKKIAADLIPPALTSSASPCLPFP